MTTEAPSSDQDTDEVVTDEVVLDVRPLIERGEEPFGTIMETVATLDGRVLVVVAPFEPTPLEGVLSAQGFTYESQQLGDAEWRVRFTPGAATQQDDTPAESVASDSAAAESAQPEPAPTESVQRTTSDDSSPSPYTIRRPGSASASASPPAASASGGSTAAPVSAPPAPPSLSPQPHSPQPSSAPSAPKINPSVMAMNPTLNVPPAWLPLGFMAAAGLGLIGFGIAVMIVAPTAVTFPRDDHVITAVHLGVLAFLSTAVLGALHQFGPVVGGRPLRSIPAGVVTGILFVPGAWTIPIGFAMGHDTVVQVGGVMATTAVCLAAWNVSRPLASTGKGAPIVGLRLAVVYLVLTAAFGVTYAFDRSHFWFPLLDNRVLAHAHLGLLGWLGLAYVAVAEKLWPMFLLAHRPHARDGERAVWLVGAGAPVATIGLLFGWKPVAIVGGVLVAAGLLSHLASLTSVIRHRRRNLELLHGFVLTSAACLVVAMVIGTIAGLAPMATETRTRMVTAEVFALILWLALAVLGHSHKIVPFISWNRLRDRGITKGRDGRPLLFAHLVNQRAAQITFLLAVSGAAIGIIGSLTATVVPIRIAGIALAVAGAVAIVNLVSGPLLMIRWHDRQLLNQEHDDRTADLS